MRHAGTDTHWAAQADQLADLSVLDLLASSVLLLDADGGILHANAAAENLFGVSRRQLCGMNAVRLFIDGPTLRQSLDEARQDRFAEKGHTLSLARFDAEPLQLSAMLVVVQGYPWAVLLELRELEHRRRIERAVEQLEQAEANRELLRNLAHEVKNPLGGLRGAAQLLQTELADERLIEYTRVIIAEADRLHALVDRLLAPHRAPRLIGEVNIHEVCERVAALVMAEFGQGLKLVRDYDISVPTVQGDKEQLIQAVLNIARNATQALSERRLAGDAEITFRTRVVRQATLNRQRHPLALALSVIDNGPGIPPPIRDRVFHPLVSARDGGTGLGLSLVQTFLRQHGGEVSFETRPGRTEFQLVLPVTAAPAYGSKP